MPIDLPGGEEQLVKRLSLGDEPAFRALFEWYTPKLLRYVWSMTKSRSQAEELVQDCFLKIWANREALANVADFDAYLFVIARNKVLDHFRKLSSDSRVRSQAWNNMRESRNSTEEAIDASESRRLIDTALRQLSDHKQKIFQLSRYEGLSHEEIAEQLGISRHTVKNHLVETLRHIRDFLHRNTDSAIILVIMHFLQA